jgi:hypothetical protein
LFRLSADAKPAAPRKRRSLSSGAEGRNRRNGGKLRIGSGTCSLVSPAFVCNSRRRFVAIEIGRGRCHET